MFGGIVRQSTQRTAALVSRSYGVASGQSKSLGSGDLMGIKTSHVPLTGLVKEGMDVTYIYRSNEPHYIEVRNEHIGLLENLPMTVTPSGPVPNTRVWVIKGSVVKKVEHIKV